jgi:hypothetical protein
MTGPGKHRPRLEWPAFNDELRADLAALIPDSGPRFGSWFDHLAICLWRLEQRPWRATDIEFWRVIDGVVRKRRRIRLAAIKDLQRQLEQPGQTLGEDLRLVDAAITALRAVTPTLPWGDLFGSFGPREPTGLTTRIVGGLTRTVLRESDALNGRQPRKQLNGSAIDFIMRRLDHCLPAGELPDRNEIARILSKLA